MCPTIKNEADCKCYLEKCMKKNQCLNPAMKKPALFGPFKILTFML